MESQMKLRGVEAGDLPFIYNSWLKSYRDSPAVRSVPNSIYFAEHHNNLEGILSSALTEVWVACDAEDESNIRGYVVVEHEGDCEVVHWVYVKQPYRQSGVARALLKCALSDSELPVFYTHYTKMSECIRGRAVYNPFLLWGR